GTRTARESEPPEERGAGGLILRGAARRPPTCPPRPCSPPCRSRCIDHPVRVPEHLRPGRSVLWPHHPVLARRPPRRGTSDRPPLRNDRAPPATLHRRPGARDRLRELRRPGHDGPRRG